MSKTNSAAKSTQEFLKVTEVKSDTLVLGQGTYRAVLAVASINFALKNPEEQNALIYGYQNFLNSLDFDIQILMQSRKMDIHSYLQTIKGLMEQQTNELLRVQTSEYLEFIAKLVENASIMNKNFYVIIPYSESPIGGGGMFSGLTGSRKNAAEMKLKAFSDVKAKLDQRVGTVAQGLNALGLRSVQLKTPEIIELLYNSYNFDAGPTIDPTALKDINLQN